MRFCLPSLFKYFSVLTNIVGFPLNGVNFLTPKHVFCGQGCILGKGIRIRVNTIVRVQYNTVMPKLRLGYLCAILVSARLRASLQDTLISGLLNRDLNAAFNHIRGLKDIVECRHVMCVCVCDSIRCDTVADFDLCLFYQK